MLIAACRAAASSVASIGSMTVIPGTARIIARSSLPWWLARKGVVMPGRKAAITAVWWPVESAIWIWSPARRVAKTQYVTATGKRPVLARPPAMPIMFCSAIPTWKKRSGNVAANGATSVYFDRSADRTTSSGRRRPNSTIAEAKGASTSGAVDGSLTTRLAKLDVGIVAANDELLYDCKMPLPSNCLDGLDRPEVAQRHACRLGRNVRAHSGRRNIGTGWAPVDWASARPVWA